MVKELFSPNLSEAVSVRLLLSFCVMPYTVKLFESCPQYAFCGNTALGKPLEVLESFFHGINKMAPSFVLHAGPKECSQYTIGSLDYSTRS